MLIIPELETVVLQPPRTGTSALKDAVLSAYPKAFLLYRHMEFAGIPSGYEQWTVVAQVRHPRRRLESLYQYMSAPEIRADTDPHWLTSVRAATSRGFEHWLLEDPYVFANPSPSEAKAFRPRYQVQFAWREQIKSQRLWAARADRLIYFESLEADAKHVLGITLDVRGASAPLHLTWTPSMEAHLRKWHTWDLSLYCETD